MNSAVAVLCLCLLAASAQAGVQISPGKCPDDVKVVQNFDAQAYMGHWYEIEAFFQIWELAGKCSTADYALNEDGSKVIVKNNMKSLIGSDVSQEGYAVVTSTTGEAKLEVTFDVPIFGERSANYLVLDTDYENYSLVYSCANVLGFKYESAWILGREKTLDAASSEKVEAAIKAAKLKRKAFRPTKQDC
ncbi:apolipoprotein D-like [Thrips palmi]|uniref:Apolipoprotein D n=1 Tax=Thrips palmi TaxID=161013 RepID=A0A6P8YJF5_THRPL|nr:apolipoprotein D-like [Thrips palmi]